jgi:hypothetical protein
MTQLVLPRNARRRLRPDRQRGLHGRPACIPRRRLLSRQQVRGRGACRRALLRGGVVWHLGQPDRSGPDPRRLRRHRGAQPLRLGRNAAANGQMAASYRSTLPTAPPEAVAKVIDRAILSAPPLPHHPRGQVPRAHPTGAGCWRLRRFSTGAVPEQGRRCLRAGGAQQ